MSIRYLTIGHGCYWGQPFFGSVGMALMPGRRWGQSGGNDGGFDHIGWRTSSSHSHLDDPLIFGKQAIQP